MALAPPFRLLPQRYPVEHLAEALAEGIVTGHPAMPQFKFHPGGDRRAARLHRQPGAAGCIRWRQTQIARAPRDAMRIATFNLESLDLPPKAAMPLEARAEVLRPALERLRADILCLQEINGQHVAGQRDRALLALDQLLAGTCYAGYARAATTGPGGHGAADVHNLVTLSRYPIRAQRQVVARPGRSAAASARSRPFRGLQRPSRCVSTALCS